MHRAKSNTQNFVWKMILYEFWTVTWISSDLGLLHYYCCCKVIINNLIIFTLAIIIVIIIIVGSILECVFCPTSSFLQVCSYNTSSFFLKYLFIYLFMAVSGLRFCARAFFSCGERGPLFIAVRGPLTIAASLVGEHRLQTRRLSSCGSRT